MSRLQEKFNAIIAKIEERITNQDELDFIKQQIADLSIMYMDEINKIIDISEKRINQVYENQKILEKKMVEIERGMSTIEKELFIEDEYDFEIVCPYCNHEFLTDISSDKKEVECPECHNVIELDWNEEEHECGGHCGSCGGCGEEDDYEEDVENDNDIEENDDEEDM